MNVRSFQGWADESDVLKTCDMKGFECGKISFTPVHSWNLPHLLSSLISSWSAGSKFLSSWYDGAQRSLSRGGHRGRYFVYFWALSVLLEKSSVLFRWNFQGASFWISQSVTPFMCLLCDGGWHCIPDKGFYISFALYKHLPITEGSGLQWKTRWLAQGHPNHLQASPFICPGLPLVCCGTFIMRV